MRESKRRQPALEALPLKATALQGPPRRFREGLPSQWAPGTLAPPRPAPGEGAGGKPPDAEATEEPRAGCASACCLSSADSETLAGTDGEARARNSEQSKRGQKRETARRGRSGRLRGGGAGGEAGRQPAEAGGGTEARGREGEQAEAERREIPVVGP